LGLNDETTPDSLTHKDIGKSVGHGSMKTAYTLKNNPESIMDITLKYFDVLTPISLNLLIQSTSLFNRSTVTHKTLSDIQNLLQKFEQHPNLSISDLQMLLGRDGF
jgi:hypothetical protein